MGELATVTYGRIFDNYERDLRQLRDSILRDSGKILRREQEASMRARWYRTGTSVESVSEQITANADSATYRLTVGTFYSIFGEYGTGQRGAATGQPTPAFYRYGSKPGMSARRFSRLAIDAAQPQIRDLHLLKMREFAKRMTA